MKSALEAIRARALEGLQNAEYLTALEEARVQLLGKKGELTAILKTMGQLSPEERPVMGQMANEVRAAIEEKLAARGAALKAAMAEQKLKMETIDVTLPGKPVREGHRHPLNLVLDEIKEIFLGIKEASPIRENPTYPYGDYFVKYGGEDLDAFTERVYGAVKGIAEHAAGECILIVSHGMAIRRFLTKFPEKAGEITGFIGNCGILEMTYADGKLTVEKIINPNG